MDILLPNFHLFMWEKYFLREKRKHCPLLWLIKILVFVSVCLRARKTPCKCVFVYTFALGCLWAMSWWKSFNERIPVIKDESNFTTVVISNLFSCGAALCWWSGPEQSLVEWQGPLVVPHWQQKSWHDDGKGNCAVWDVTSFSDLMLKKESEYEGALFPKRSFD